MSRNAKFVDIPPSVFSRPRGTLLAVAGEKEAVLFLREDEWGLRRYPRECPAELRLASWDFEPVLVAIVLARLARSDGTTYDCLVDLADPTGVRLLQDLSQQSQIDLHLVVDQIVRSFRIANPVRKEATALVSTAAARPPWPPAQFQQVAQRVSKLYPTPDTLWWSLEKSSA